MTSTQQIAEQVCQFVAARANITTGTREDIKRYVAELVEPLTPQQPCLNFEDQQAVKGQSEAILKLLKERRSQGVTNWERRRKSGTCIHCAPLKSRNECENLPFDFAARRQRQNCKMQGFTTRLSRTHSKSVGRSSY